MLKVLSAAALAACLISSSASAAEAYTPRPGSAERTAIMDELRRYCGLDLKFVVSKLLIEDDAGDSYAYANVTATTGRTLTDNGTEALLLKHGGLWTVVLGTGCDQDDIDTSEAALNRYERRLAAEERRFPRGIIQNMPRPLQMDGIGR